MSTQIRSTYKPAFNVFEVGRLSPADTARSLAVWRNFVKTRLSQLLKLDPPAFAVNTERYVVCLLRKRLPNLEFALRNCRVTLGGEWGLQLVTTPVLKPWAEKLTAGWQGVNIVPILRSEIEENKFKRSVDFLEQIAGEYLLLIDDESILCHGGIEEFLSYDYVAPVWRESDVSPWCRFGRGGFSLRRKSALLNICRDCNVNPDLIPDESIFFSLMLRLQQDRYRLPDDAVAARFAVERCYHDTPFALHKAWQYIDHGRLKHIFDRVELAESNTGNSNNSG